MSRSVRRSAAESDSSQAGGVSTDCISRVRTRRPFVVAVQGVGDFAHRPRPPATAPASSPATPWALARAIVTWTILTVVALLAGMNVDGGGVELFGLYGLAVLVNLTATMWAAGVAMRVRSIQGGPLMQFPVFLVLFLAPVYVPLSLLSGWIHAVASVNPVTALLEAGRGFIAGEPAVVALAFALAVVLPVLFALWARGGLRRAEAAG